METSKRLFGSETAFGQSTAFVRGRQVDRVVAAKCGAGRNNNSFRQASTFEHGEEDLSRRAGSEASGTSGISSRKQTPERESVAPRTLRTLRALTDPDCRNPSSFADWWRALWRSNLRSKPKKRRIFVGAVDREMCRSNACELSTRNVRRRVSVSFSPWKREVRTLLREARTSRCTARYGHRGAHPGPTRRLKRVDARNVVPRLSTQATVVDSSDTRFGG